MKKEKMIRILIAFIGVVMIGIGVSFNAQAALGNDPIGIVYDGIRTTMHFSSDQLGTASNIVNLVLIVIVFWMDRRYVDIGTLVYIIPYGVIVNVGAKLYHALFHVQQLPTQILAAVIGCTLLYVGVGIYIAADIGVDPFSGLVLALTDKVKKEYQTVKVTFDLICILVGFVLGGKLGAITIITALTAGPCIQFVSRKIRSIKFVQKLF